MKSLLWNIRYELSELRYSTELPLVILFVPIAIFGVGYIAVEMIRSFI